MAKARMTVPKYLEIKLNIPRKNDRLLRHIYRMTPEHIATVYGYHF
jgi:hypothetical protein